MSEWLFSKGKFASGSYLYISDITDNKNESLVLCVWEKVVTTFSGGRLRLGGTHRREYVFVTGAKIIKKQLLDQRKITRVKVDRWKQTKKSVSANSSGSKNSTVMINNVESWSKWNLLFQGTVPAKPAWMESIGFFSFFITLTLKWSFGFNLFSVTMKPGKTWKCLLI